MKDTKKRGAKALAPASQQGVEIVGKTPDHIADEQARLVAIDNEVRAVLGGAYSHQEMAMRGAQAVRGSSALDIVAGVYFAMLKKSAGHGEYLDLLDQFGVPHRTAQKKVAYARAVLGHDLSQWKRASLAAIGPTKIKLLEEFTDAELDQLAEGEEVAGVTLDSISRMTTAQLQKALRASQQRVEDLEEGSKSLAEQLGRAKEDAARARRQFRALSPSQLETQLRSNFDEACGVVEVSLGRHGTGEPPSGLAAQIDAWLEEPEGQDEARLYIGTRLEYLSKLIASLRVSYGIDQLGDA